MDDTSLRQERHIVSLCRTDSTPRALYLGTANGDSERSQLKFMKAFGALGCKADTLCFFPYDMKHDYGAAVREADLIYVGGGNTPAMLAVWRQFGFDTALRDAYEAGTVLAGISAGANCWFERYVTDSVPGGGVREGLGFLPGVFCPHLDSEAWREPVVRALDGEVAAAGEGVMVHYRDGGWQEAWASRTPAMCLRQRAGEAMAAVEPRTLPLD
jgi:peptidase E